MFRLYIPAVTFLPIAARELRVAARKRGTFWLRVIAALIGLVIGCACMMIAHVGGIPTPAFGTALFAVLTWLGFGAAIAAGLFFTSDCLSEEKREGTLGFLFLTDLRGYDVVVGKLLATSLRGVFALLAIFPILAITMLMGGVTGAQFWKTALALANAMFFSLALGVLVSAISHDAQKAMAATFVLLFLFVAGGPIADGIYGAVHKTGFIPRLSLGSPGYVFKIAGGWGRTPFWQALATTQVISWLMFLLASMVIPRTWQQKAGNKGMATKGWVYDWKYGRTARREKLRRKLLSRDAVLWLACRERWQSLGIWLIAILFLAGFVMAMIELPPESWMAWRFFGPLLTFPLYLWAASQSCRFFVEARRTGLTELLLAAPLREGAIVRGHWRALVRMFAWPVLILLCLNALASGLSQYSWKNIYSRATSGSGAVSVTITSANTNATGTNSAPPSAASANRLLKTIAETPAILTTVIAALSTGLAVTANILALCWFGMWMGVTSKNANLATLKTLALVQIVPALVIQFASTMGVGLLLMPLAYSNNSAATSTWFLALWPLVADLSKAFLTIAKDVGFILWSRRKLYHSFRERAARSLNPVLVRPRPLPPSSAGPPIIAASA